MKLHVKKCKKSDILINYKEIRTKKLFCMNINKIILKQISLETIFWPFEIKAQSWLRLNYNEYR